MTDKKIPKQILPIIDPNASEGDDRYLYYLLEEPNSPSVAPPNAAKVVQYARRQFLHDDPDDFRRPYGYAEYSRELTFEDIDNYNLLPFDRDQIILFDLWKSFNKDKVKMAQFFTLFFKIMEDDPQGNRLKMASKLITETWSLKKIKSTIKSI